MPTHKFEAKPKLEMNGSVSWTLCYTNPNPDQCGTTKGTYPDVTIPKGSGKHGFEYKITGDATGLGLKFANDPLWIKRGSQPTGPGIDSQIESLGGKGTPTLTFVDKNSKPSPFDPAPIELKYQLNFVDKNSKKVTEIDPDIKNGGTDFIGDNQTATLLAGIALLVMLAAIWFGIRALRRNAAPSAAARGTETSATERPGDVNRDVGDGE